MLEEKRKHIRFKVLNLAAAFRRGVTGEEEREHDRGVIVDISLGGLAYASTRMFCLGDRIDFNFLPGDLHVSGTVARVQQADSHYLHGVEFKWLSYLNTLRLTSWIQKLMDRLIAARTVPSEEPQ